ncbi:MAG TPA: molecular chaperone TorD family protein [Bacteroidales bacterium]|nr:molecular chaperone TorD family protein [Bacteroidales bacterium]HQK68646.1 molecular chaperone TorD family protein [Bacteroidales bacterium]
MLSNEELKNLLKGYNMLLYFSGSMILSEPTDECVVDFWNSNRLKQLPVSSFNPRFLKASSLLWNSCSDKEICSKKLSDDYFRLFETEGLPLAPALESIFKKHPGGRSKQDDYVGSFYDSYGWNNSLRGKIKDDHLGIELLFLTRLIEKYLQLDDEPCRTEMKKEILRFINSHILSWIPAWNKVVTENSRTFCYKGIADLIYASVEDINNILSET